MKINNFLDKIIQASRYLLFIFLVVTLFFLVIIIAVVFGEYRAIQGNKIPLGQCETLFDPIQQDRCYLELARQERNIEFCEKMNHKESFYHMCWYGVIDGIGTYPTNHPPHQGICQSLETIEDRDECYLEVAFKLQDRGICEKISLFQSQKDCLTYVSQPGVSGWIIPLWTRKIERYLEDQNYERAIAEYNRLIFETSISDPYLISSGGELYAGRAEVFEKMGNYDKAIADWSKKLIFLEG